uniref:Uncharacterized protein n=1 Tax=Romanomermis culicivorax TaxID=13658 RepID=A0A915J3N6_ROMCU
MSTRDEMTGWKRKIFSALCAESISIAGNFFVPLTQIFLALCANWHKCPCSGSYRTEISMSGKSYCESLEYVILTA